MTQSERQAATGTLEAWDDLFRCASAQEQQRLLSLAAATGVLYAQQLPINGNGHPQAADAAPLSTIAEGKLPPLPTFTVETSRVTPQVPLDESQRYALALALQTPDLGLIEGGPGSGKSRVIAEVISAAVREGQRVVFLAPNAAAIDHVLQQVAGRPHILAVRLLGPRENAESLPGAIRPLTVKGRVEDFERNVLARTRDEISSLSAKQSAADKLERTWEQLRQAAVDHTGCEKQRQSVQSRLDAIDVEIEKEAELVRSGRDATGEAGFAQVLHTIARNLEETLRKTEVAAGDIKVEMERHQKVLDEATRTRDRVSRLHDARAKKKWWTLIWWRTVFAGDLAARLDGLNEQIHGQVEEMARLKERRDQVEKQVQDARLEAKHAETDAVAIEVAKRSNALNEQLATIDAKLDQLSITWRQLCGAVELGDGASPAAFDAAYRSWQVRRENDRLRLAELERWQTSLQESLSTLGDRVLGHANLVAGTLDILGSNELNTAAGKTGPAFDLMILDDAHLAADDPVKSAAALARRTVLVGEAGHHAGSHSDNLDLATSLFRRAWARVHADPRNLPYAWIHENGRICCQLRPVSADQRRWLEAERLADSSEIELRIYSPPGRTPQLAEILFPKAMEIAQAKCFVFHELQELAISGTSHGFQWLENDDRLTLRLADAPTTTTATVPLTTGVRELVYLTEDHHSPPKSVTGSPVRRWQTCCLEFDRQAGWHTERVRQWLKHASGFHDHGRTARLLHCHRMAAGMSLVLTDWLALANLASGRCDNGAAEHAPVEFIPVPPLSRPRLQPHDRLRRGSRIHESAAPADTSAVVLPKSGAGLELDLSDPRQRERLPAELRGGLPTRGFANYLEAQRILGAARSLSQIDQKSGVAIIALDPAQVALLRNMIRTQLPQAAIQVGMPGAFRHQEFGTVLVSMTRSHTHRPVHYGDALSALPLAMTRARNKLILFADPGTLVRRTQWSGPVEQRDESTCLREREFLLRLVPYLHGQGNHARWFRLGESNGT